jgi:hypothetical protein
MRPTLLFLFVLHAAAAATPTGIAPFLDCVSFDPSSNQLTAFFGYVSANSGSVTVPVGPNNFISPEPDNRGQTTVFQPGANTDAWQTTFDVTQTPSITWTVLGQSVSAVNDPTVYCSSCVCPPGPTGAQGPQGPPGVRGPAVGSVQAISATGGAGSATASCSSQQTLLGGGGACLIGGQNGSMASSSASGSSWTVVCSVGQATAVALCAGPNSP